MKESLIPVLLINCVFDIATYLVKSV